MNHRLDFLNPTWHYGRNVTIRLGDKWALKAERNDTVSLHQTGYDLPLAVGNIAYIGYKPFKTVTIEDLFGEHDPECRNPDGLVRAMLRAYPNFNLDSWVTVIWFII